MIVEAPLDALALWSHGYPAVAKFSGNSRHGGWRPEFNQLIASAAERIIVADNDARQKPDGSWEYPGRDIARMRASQVPRSRIVTPPSPYKDIGELYSLGKSELVTALLGIPPITGCMPEETP